MKKETKRQKAARETRRKLLESARLIVSRNGLSGTSVDEITSMCGVAKGTFYTYFKRKEDIVSALCHETFTRIRDEAIACRGSFPERLSFYMAKFAGYIEESSLKLCQEWIRNTAEPEFSGNRDGMDKLEFDLDSMEMVFRDGIERGEVKPDAPVERLSRTLTDVLYGTMLCWATSNGKYDFVGEIREFSGSFLPVLLAPYLVDHPGKSQTTPEGGRGI